MRGHHPYPSYALSGVEWIGDLPSHWQVLRLRYACDLNPTKAEIKGIPSDTLVTFLPMEKIGEDGSIALDELREVGDVSQGYTYFRDDDVIVAKITPCFENGKGALVRHLHQSIGFGTTELHVLRAKPGIEPRFIFYLTRCDEFRSHGTAMMYGAAGQQRVPEAFLRYLWIPVPPADEQHAIADFLDRETARIDALIARKQRLIELLQEKRTALISHAVTKGLDAGVAMKESGVAWLGQVPAHWEIRPLRAVVQLRRGFDLTVAQREAGTVPVYSSSGLSGYHDTALVKGPGVVTGRYGTVGQIFYVEDDFWPMNTALYGKEFWGNDAQYVSYLLTILPFDAYSGKSAVPGIDRNDLDPIKVVCPPRDEQLAITSHLVHAGRKLEEAAQMIETVIAKLQEYRTALISAAVTGKIDVRQQ